MSASAAAFAESGHGDGPLNADWALGTSRILEGWIA